MAPLDTVLINTVKARCRLWETAECGSIADEEW